MVVVICNAGGDMNENEFGGSCSTHGKFEEFTEGFDCKTLKETDLNTKT
jgi:hypothetical protein